MDAVRCDRCHDADAAVRFDGRRFCADCYALHRRRREQEQQAWLAERAGGVA